MAFIKRAAGTGTYKWPVEVKTPNNGEYETESFTLIFKRLKSGQAGGYKNDLEFLKAVIVGWEDYNDSDGKPVPFSQKELKELLDDEYFVIAATLAWTSALAGAREKN